jgi:osmotically-inducible protein OsmY
MSALQRMFSLVQGPRTYVQGGVSRYELEKMERQIDDTLTAAAVKAAIHQDPDLRMAGIHVAASRNVIQLSGFVESRHVIGKAIAAARNVRGVRAVRNDMRLK